jgi:hypothetical protein
MSYKEPPLTITQHQKPNYKHKLKRGGRSVHVKRGMEEWRGLCIFTNNTTTTTTTTTTTGN